MRVFPTSHRRPWPALLLLFSVVVIVCKIAFLCSLDMVKKASMLQSWTTSLAFLPSSSLRSAHHILLQEGEGGPCIEFLEMEDNVSYARNFDKDPVQVVGVDQDWTTCTVGCKFGFLVNKIPDATFGLSTNPATATVHRKGFNIIMTTSLSSDVPVGYFSWAEYDIMTPLRPKTAEGIAAAFISNCGAHNFRLQALSMLEKLDVKIDSYGSCHRNHVGNVDKVDTLKQYKFSLAFENSNEEDYVTEKFFQSLVSGAVPVVVGAPNIQDFAPSPNSVLHIKELDDVTSVAKTMKFLAANPTAYNKTLSWKFDGPSDSFKALVDMAAVHSSCRLCVHIATMIHDKEESSSYSFQKRPCKRNSKMGTLYHLYVRERGRFKMESVFLSSRHLTIKGLELAVLKKFNSLNHVPIWKSERPKCISGGEELRVYKLYPVGLTQRQALYSFRFESDVALRTYIENHPCSKFEVIFV